MSKHEAKAKKLYDAYVSHCLEYLMDGRRDAPIASQYKFKNGWIMLGRGRNYRTDAWYACTQEWTGWVD